MKITALLTVLATCLITVSTMSYQDEVAAAEIYRLEVCAGIIHDWKGIEPECPWIQPQPRYTFDQ